MTRKAILYIILYYFIAMAFKYVAVYIYPDIFLVSAEEYDFTPLFLGAGPLVGGLVLVYVFNRKNDISLFKTGFVDSLSFVFLVMLIFTGFSYYNTGEINFSIAKYVLFSIIYSAFEEYGWRGYLQTELKPLNKVLKYFIISIIWFFWHLEFDITWYGYLVILLGSFGMGYVADKSKSLTYVAIFHSLVNLGLTTDMNSITQKQKLIGVCIVAVAIILNMRFGRVIKIKLKTLLLKN